MESIHTSSPFFLLMYKLLKIMKKITFIICLLSFCFLGQAQNISSDNSTETKEVRKLERVKVVLKNGNVLYGKLIAYSPDTGLELQIYDHTMTIPDNRIKKLKMYSRSIKNVYLPLKTKKFYFRTNAGLLSNTNGTGTTLNISALYQFNNYFSAGVGLGVDNYYFNAPHNIFPVFSEFKAYLMDKKSSPFVSLKTGYSFNRAHEDSGQLKARGGILVNPTFGYRFGSSGIMFDVYGGIRYQKANYERLSWAFSTQEILWRRVELGMALSF